MHSKYIQCCTVNGTGVGRFKTTKAAVNYTHIRHIVVIRILVVMIYCFEAPTSLLYQHLFPFSVPRIMYRLIPSFLPYVFTKTTRIKRSIARYSNILWISPVFPQHFS